MMATINLNITRLECKDSTAFNFLGCATDLNITRLECKELCYVLTIEKPKGVQIPVLFEYNQIGM